MSDEFKKKATNCFTAFGHSLWSAIGCQRFVVKETKLKSDVVNILQLRNGSSIGVVNFQLKSLYYLFIMKVNYQAKGNLLLTSRAETTCHVDNLLNIVY